MVAILGKSLLPALRQLVGVQWCHAVLQSLHIQGMSLDRGRYTGPTTSRTRRKNVCHKLRICMGLIV